MEGSIRMAGRARSRWPGLIRTGLAVIQREGWESFLIKALEWLFQFSDHREGLLYRIWIYKHEWRRRSPKAVSGEIAKYSYQPRISVIVPAHGSGKKLPLNAIKSLFSQVYHNWELLVATDEVSPGERERLFKMFREDSRVKVITLAGAGEAAKKTDPTLQSVTGEFVLLFDQDIAFAPRALFEVVKRLNREKAPDVLYSDSDRLSKGLFRRCCPEFKPEWSPDTLLSCNYIGHFSVFRRTVLDKLAGFREGFPGFPLYDLLLRLIGTPYRIERIPEILYHFPADPAPVSPHGAPGPDADISGKKAISSYLLERSEDAEVIDGLHSGSCRVRYTIRPGQRVSIIIPNKDKVGILQNCIASIVNKTSFQYFEIVIVDNQSENAETYEYYNRIKEEHRITILRYDKPFNYSALNNFAVKSVKSDHLLFLNNDTEVISEEWLAALLEFSQRDEIGAVGAKLYYSNHTIQHAGVIVGIKGTAGHSHKTFSGRSKGYLGRLNIIQNVSAVTGACMMVPKKVYEEVSGFDERMPVSFNDVDLCLRIREKGYRIIFTPYAELYHHESQSRKNEDSSERAKRVQEEFGYFQQKWKKVLGEGDPYYSPNLTLEREDFSYRL